MVEIYIVLKRGKKTSYISLLKQPSKLSFEVLDTEELKWLEHFWNHENMFETGVVRANEFYRIARLGGILGISFRFSFT